MKRVLVTGSSGFIGSSLVPYLQKNYDVLEFSRKNDRTIMRKSDFEGIKCDYVVHLAAVIDSSDEDLQLRVNVEGTKNVLDYCVEQKAKMVFLSSAAVNGRSFYGFTKQVGENLCRQYSVSKGLDATVLRLFNIYGPNQTEKSIIQNILNQGRSEPVKIHNPYATRDFIYESDVHSAIEKSFMLKGYHRLNLGSGKGTMMRELATTLTNEKVITLGNNEGNFHSLARIEETKRVLGWEPKVSLEEGLVNVIKAREDAL